MFKKTGLVKINNISSRKEQKMKNSKEKLIICSAIIFAVVVATIIGICVSKKTKQIVKQIVKKTVHYHIT